MFLLDQRTEFTLMALNVRLRTRNMVQTAAAVLTITACFLIAVHTDQGFDCRKLVYTPHCRGIARKRVDLGIREMQPGIPQDSLSLKRLSYELSPAKELLDGRSALGKTEERPEDNKQKHHHQPDNLLYKLFMTGKRIDDDDNLPLYEY
ncbi:UNVERIFIED_CONTAM: hypothetical protein PYX00_002265 [Menopon gallinae]|uniref:Uncharacterized protein n=1 Tax=Menopon gallinae TaxID=328185 RepID=A0AAW2IGB9_9NEOP